MLVDEMLTAVRDQLDEDETADVSNASLLRAMNRGQQKLVRLATRHYPDLFRRETSSTVSSRELTLPEGSYGYIINEVDAVRSGVAYKLQSAQLRQLTQLDNNASSTIPSYYAQQGNILKLFPTPNSVTIRVRYQLRPPPLVAAQGRIAALGTNAVTLDALGTGLTTDTSALGAFVNWVDGTSGEVKASLQVLSINTSTKEVAFKTTGLYRTTVFGQTVASASPTDGEVDDYLCLASGSCVPLLISDYSDYIIQFAVVELKRKSGEPAPEDYAALKEIEEDIRALWSGRPSQRRVERKNPYWE